MGVKVDDFCYFATFCNFFFELFSSILVTEGNERGRSRVVLFLERIGWVTSSFGGLFGGLKIN